jgi:peptide/nickel transport system permease protein
VTADSAILAVVPEPALAPPTAGWPLFWRRFRRRPLAVASALVVLLYALVAAGVWAGGSLAPANGLAVKVEQRHLDQRLRPPSAAHWCGTDYLGRDVFWRTVYGVRTAMYVGLLAGVISIVVGVVLGALGGYFGGWLDAFVVWIYSTFAAMPTLLFILTFALLLGRGLTPVYIGIGITSWVGLCRVVRAEFMRLRDLPYVQAARVQGVGDGRLIWRHILPNTLHLVIVFFTLRFSLAVMTEVIVSFLGLGVQLEPSWGVMIAEAKERLWQGVWWELAAATAAMFGLVLALNVLGDALRDLLDPRLNSAV